MSRTLTLGISPCPNDTFMFGALLTGRISTPFRFRLHMADVEELNRMVLAGSLDVSKVSYHLYGHVRNRYSCLRAGSALGRGCGPVLVSRGPVTGRGLAGLRIAIPGEYTTAALLLRMYSPDAGPLVTMNFARIPGAVASGEVDAGVIIHESRFTYRNLGLECVRDLGEWWEKGTGRPIPLGGIVARHDLGHAEKQALERSIRASIEYAFENRDEIFPFIKEHAQELDRDIIEQHIALYVNRYSIDYGDEGGEAIEFLLRRGSDAGIF